MFEIRDRQGGNVIDSFDVQNQKLYMDCIKLFLI